MRSPFPLALIALALSTPPAFGAETARDPLASAAAVARPDAASGAPISAAEHERRALVAIRIGPRSITVGELEDRLARIPPRQLTAFGTDTASIRRGFTDQVVVPEAVLSLGAEKRRLAESGQLKQSLAHAYSDAAQRHVKLALGPASDIPLNEAQRYYDEHLSQFVTDERISVFRILCKTQGEAVSVLEAAKNGGTLKTFSELSQAHSIDKATALRAGNLGFLTSDGRSNEAGLLVDPAIVHAAARVKDGEFVDQPIPEGEGFAVVWRRGTVARTSRSFDSASREIREAIWKQKAERAERDLITDLRARHLRDLDLESVVTLDVPPPKPVMITRKPQ